ncbi:MAG: 7-cyano-7-deazaguanine synthase [Planctomycetota bacterium]
MAQAPLVVMVGGGPRGLVAAAVAVDQRRSEQEQVVLVHVADGRPSADNRLAAVQKQAEQLGGLAVVVHHAPGLAPPTGEAAVDLSSAQRILAATSVAMGKGADRLIWPAAVDGDELEAARAAEQALLCQHVAHASVTGGDARLRIDTPLLEIDDAQLIQLGEELRVDWTSAWACRRGAAEPCQACTGCDRRRQAFVRARVVDPIDDRRPVAAAG